MAKGLGIEVLETLDSGTYDAAYLGRIADEAIERNRTKHINLLLLHAASLALTSENEVERILADGIADRLYYATGQQG